MPYDSITELPEAVRNRYSPRCQGVFLKTFNRTVADSGIGGSLSEEKAFKIAHTAAGMCKDAGQADAKALMPLKAQLLDDDEFQAWFDGRIPRRLLAIPFGGPIPSKVHAKGVDLDGETFTERTDIFGGYRALKQTRERLVDFHHSAKPPGPRYGDDTGLMSGHILGKSILDPDPDEDGWWVDLWWERGNRRVAMIKKLAERGTQLFGSSQPIGKAARNDDGEITVWPFWMETISPAPQNTYSVIRPKAALDVVVGNPFWSDIEAAMRDLGSDLRLTSLEGEDAAKAGRVLSSVNVDDLEAAIEAADRVLAALRVVRSRQSETAGREPASEQPM